MLHKEAQEKGSGSLGQGTGGGEKGEEKNEGAGGMDATLPCQLRGPGVHSEEILSKGAGGLEIHARTQGGVSFGEGCLV